MRDLSRRDVLKTGTLGFAIGCGAAGIAPAGAAGTRAFFVFDGRFGDSARAAAAWQAAGATVIDASGTDLWHAWHGPIAKALPERPAIEGLTPWSVAYICEQLGREHGLRWHARAPANRELTAWALMPNRT